MSAAASRRLAHSRTKTSKMLTSQDLVGNENIQPNHFIETSPGGKGNIFTSQHALRTDQQQEDDSYGQISLTLK